MHISWLGQSAFKIDFKTAQSEGTLSIDPYEHAKETMPRSITTDLALFSRGEKNAITLSKEPCVIAEAGEYEYKEVLVYGFQTALQKTAPLVFRLEVEHVTIAHLGLMSAVPNENLVNELQGVDVLMLSVGGGDGLTPERAAELVTKLEPRIVIPYAFKADGTGAEFEPVTKFLKLMGKSDTEAIPKYKFGKKDLPTDTIELVLLEKQ
ncbi:MAG: MBL fold metallo-hydrolase [Candidatus Magasanikbacteria bacterium]|nr:MBL fold metallo-hydrolase [Candidatus Magasanikbacteria bacterium]